MSPKRQKKKVQGPSQIQDRKARRAKGEQFRRRRINLGKKGQDLVSLCGARVYTVVERNDQIWEFNSEPHDGEWPPNRDELKQDGRVEHQGPDNFSRDGLRSDRAADLNHSVPVRAAIELPQQRSANRQRATKILHFLQYFSQA